MGLRCRHAARSRERPDSGLRSKDQRLSGGRNRTWVWQLLCRLPDRSATVERRKGGAGQRPHLRHGRGRTLFRQPRGGRPLGGGFAIPRSTNRVCRLQASRPGCRGGGYLAGPDARESGPAFRACDAGRVPSRSDQRDCIAVGSRMSVSPPCPCGGQERQSTRSHRLLRCLAARKDR